MKIISIRPERSGGNTLARFNVQPEGMRLFDSALKRTAGGYPILAPSTLGGLPIPSHLKRPQRWPRWHGEKTTVGAHIQHAHNRHHAQPRYHKELQCYVHATNYNFDKKHGEVVMGEYGCTDMAGCIAMFERIDPSVVAIYTGYRGGALDTVYRKVNQEWVAQ